MMEPGFKNKPGQCQSQSFNHSGIVFERQSVNFCLFRVKEDRNENLEIISGLLNVII